MALIVGGTTVTGTQVLDATKLSGNLPALNASSLTSVPAASVTQGTWTPSFNVGSYGSVAGKYQKAGQIVWCQAEGQMTTASAADNTVVTMGGLPFTSLNIDSGGYTNWSVANGDFHVNGTPRKITLGRNTQTAYISAGSIKHQQHSRWLFTGIYDSDGNNLGSYGAAHALRSDDFNDIYDNSTKNWWFVSFIYISSS